MNLEFIISISIAGICMKFDHKLDTHWIRMKWQRIILAGRNVFKIPQEEAILKFLKVSEVSKL